MLQEPWPSLITLSKSTPQNSIQPGLYARRIRDLMGHGECIMGLIDNYPSSFEFIDQPLLKKIELACIEWRWRIKHRAHRLCRVHGDFHPYNILFRDGTDFTLLDRSRGEWGEPSDDTSCLSINYLFSSLLSSGKFGGPFERLFMSFWDNSCSRILSGIRTCPCRYARPYSISFRISWQPTGSIQGT